MEDYFKDIDLVEICNIKAEYEDWQFYVKDKELRKWLCAMRQGGIAAALVDPDTKVRQLARDYMEKENALIKFHFYSVLNCEEGERPILCFSCKKVFLCKNNDLSWPVCDWCNPCLRNAMMYF